MQLKANHIPSFNNSVLRLERILQDYIDHGILLDNNDYTGTWQEVRARYRAEAPAKGITSNDLVPRRLCRQAAKDLGWRFAYAARTQSGDYDKYPHEVRVRLTVDRAAAKLIAPFLLVGDVVNEYYHKRDVNNVRVWYRPRVIQIDFITPKQVALFDSWYASCYRNPDVVRALTKRGHPIHTYPDEVKLAA